MAIDKRAGQPAQQSDLINVAQLTAQYYVLKPEVGNAEHAVKFGTSGHRGSAARHNFNEPHILAIAQAIVTAHRGVIRAESSAQEGTAFQVLLPAAGRTRRRRNLKNVHSFF